jgi:hypothetical protein
MIRQALQGDPGRYGNSAVFDLLAVRLQGRGRV